MNTWEIKIDNHYCLKRYAFTDTQDKGNIICDHKDSTSGECCYEDCPLKASQQPVEAKCGCKHEDRFDCEYMDENKNCAINKKG